MIMTLSFVSFYQMTVKAGPVNTGTDEGKEINIILKVNMTSIVNGITQLQCHFVIKSL